MSSLYAILESQDRDLVDALEFGSSPQSSESLVITVARREHARGEQLEILNLVLSIPASVVAASVAAKEFTRWLRERTGQRKAVITLRVKGDWEGLDAYRDVVIKFPIAEGSEAEIVQTMDRILKSQGEMSAARIPPPSE